MEEEEDRKGEREWKVGQEKEKKEKVAKKRGGNIFNNYMKIKFKMRLQMSWSKVRGSEKKRKKKVGKGIS